MLRNLKDLETYAIRATDGPIGHVKDFYFDDDAWVVRYFVVNTGSWLSGREVLISPVAVRHPDWLERTLPASLTKEQVKNSPDIDTDKPVSRQHEAQLLSHYGYPNYWGAGALWGAGLYPYAMQQDFAGLGADRAEHERELEAFSRTEKSRHRNDDPHLRSCNTVSGYQVHATDGDIGHVAGFLVDDQTWSIRYLVVNTSNWWVGHKVLIAPAWIKGVHWDDESVSVDLNRESVKTAPLYDSTLDWSRDQELSLHRHHGRTVYWADSDAATGLVV